MEDAGQPGPPWAQAWRDGDHAALAQALQQLPASGAAAADLAFAQGLLALMREQAQVLPWLEQAWAGHVAHQRPDAAAADAHAALACCLIDIGAMDQLRTWLQRARELASQPAPVDRLGCWWWRLGLLAQAVLDTPAPAGVPQAVAALEAQLREGLTQQSANERLITALVLVNLYFHQGRYEQLELLAAEVEQPALVQAAAPLMRCRWRYMLGFAQYQLGQVAAAESAWQQVLDEAQAQGHVHMQVLASLAMLRLLLDRGRLEEADALERTLPPRWGGSRPTQLMELQQMRARLLLLKHQPAAALARLQDALALATQAGLSEPEQASCLTDLAQVRIALGEQEAALVLLHELGERHSGRDAEVYRCLEGLLQAWLLASQDAAAARVALEAALQRAQAVRYTMFFRLLPALAGELCALALRWQLLPAFVTEVVHQRALPAPDEADGRWPWAVWLRLLGGFELRLQGQPQSRSGKAQHKPLELLRLLCCQPALALAMDDAADALWPDADGPGGRKNLEMTVQRLRRLLGDDRLVRVGDGRVGLDATRVNGDLPQRRRALQALQALAMRPDLAPQELAAVGLPCLQRLLEAGSGLLLPGAPPSPWVLAEREACERERQRALQAGRLLLQRLGWGDDAIEVALQPLQRPEGFSSAG